MICSIQGQLYPDFLKANASSISRAHRAWARFLNATFFSGNLSLHLVPLRNVEVLRREERDGPNSGQNAQAESPASAATAVPAAASYGTLTDESQQLAQTGQESRSGSHRNAPYMTSRLFFKDGLIWDLLAFGPFLKRLRPLDYCAPNTLTLGYFRRNVLRRDRIFFSTTGSTKCPSLKKVPTCVFAVWDKKVQHARNNCLLLFFFHQTLLLKVQSRVRPAEPP